MPYDGPVDLRDKRRNQATRRTEQVNEPSFDLRRKARRVDGVN
jgi:hypothetical protein